MATYASLTTEEKEILGAWERNMRGYIHEFASLIIKTRVLNDSYRASDGPKAIADTLDAGQVVPNTGGLSGAQSLDVDTEFGAMADILADVLTTYDVVGMRQNFTKAAGPTTGL